MVGYASPTRPTIAEFGIHMADNDDVPFNRNFPLKPGVDLPTIPPGGWQRYADLKALNVRVIDGIAVPGRDENSYAVLRRTYHRNLYRIPLQ